MRGEAMGDVADMVLDGTLARARSVWNGRAART